MGGSFDVPDLFLLQSALNAGNLVLGHVLLKVILFDVIVGADLSSSMNRPARTEPVRTAFASYAREDWPEVVRRVHGIQAAGIDVFLDVLTLRAGDAWEEQVFASILARDIFFLFWSPAAMHSPWVEREWRFALAQRGIEFIHPVPRASPELAPPPEELASRHFNDLILLCLASHQVALANPTHLEPDSL